MFQLHAAALYGFVADLTTCKLDCVADKEGIELRVSAAAAAELQPLLKSCDNLTSLLWLPSTKARKGRLVQALEGECTQAELGLQLRILGEGLEDELKNLLILHMPPGQARHYFAGENLLGAAVVKRFSALATDIDEAGKCLGAGRYTAAVFHFMRVMETGVQQFGDRLGVILLDKHNQEKSWHNILEEVDKALKQLPNTDPAKVSLAELSASLYAVKLAWRNEVMHPKASYSVDEAENVWQATKAYMGQLSALV